MKTNPQIHRFLKDFQKIIQRENQYKQIYKARIIKIEDKTITLSTDKVCTLPQNTLIEINKIKGKIIKNNHKNIIIQLEKNLELNIEQTVNITDIQNQIIINKLENIYTTIYDKKINHHNQETLAALFTDNYQNNYNDITTSNKNLNPKQLEALNKSISTQKFHIIKGPPGTGKTHSIVAIIKYLLNNDYKILITTHTHIAIDNILEKLDDIDDHKILRIGLKEKISPSVYKYTIDEQIKKLPEYQQIQQLELHNYQLKHQLLNKPEKLSNYNKSINKNQSHENKKSIINRIISKFYNLNYNEETTIENEDVEDDADIINHINNNNQQIQKIKNDIQHDLSDKAQIIASTILSSSSNILKDIEFDYVIMDEASQVPVYLAIIPLMKTQRFILIGDDKQLQPITPNNTSNNLSKSIFNHMITKYPQHYTFLNIQYRMNQQISNISSKLYYQNKVKTHTKNQDIKIEIDNNHILIQQDPITFIDTNNCQYFEENTNGGCINKNEAQLLIYILKYLLKQKINTEDIGIITPYRKQKLYIQKLLNKEQLDVETDTIYRFQGREKDVIIITFCKSSNHSLSKFQSNFISEENQLNVSITRSKKKLIIIGDSSQLKQSKNLKKLIREITPFNTVYLEDII